VEGGEDAYVGVPTMNAPMRDLAEGVNVERGNLVTGLRKATQGEWTVQIGEREENFSTVVVAIPAEQATSLLRDSSSDLAAVADGIPSTPCWTVMVVFDQRVEAGDVIDQAGMVNFASRQEARPGREERPEAWVIHSDGEWS